MESTRKEWLGPITVAFGLDGTRGHGSTGPSPQQQDSTRAVAPALEDLIALPEPVGDIRLPGAFALATDGYTADQMREMWRVGRAAGIEEAAKVCEQAPYNSGIKLMCADRIRSLAPAVPASGV